MFGVTKSEISVVFVLALGLLIAFMVKTFSTEEEEKYNISENIYYVLDSLAEVNRTTYTGTDTKNNPIPELAKADTIVKKESYFPKAPKKADKISSKININTASKVQLMKLPGVGESTAIKIIEYRKGNSFGKPEDITKVKGIGAKKFEKMKPFICVQ